MAALPEEQREAIQRRCFEGHSIGHVAEIVRFKLVIGGQREDPDALTMFAPGFDRWAKLVEEERNEARTRKAPNRVARVTELPVLGTVSMTEHSASALRVGMKTLLVFLVLTTIAYATLAVLSLLPTSF